MLFAYLTTDEMNWDLANRWAEECDIVLFPLTFQDSLFDGSFDGVILDWDFIPSEKRSRILEQFTLNRPTIPLAVHGYHVQGEELWKKGVIAFRRLEEKWLRFLKRLVEKRKGNRIFRTSQKI
jgi:hypothetical protein